MTSLQKSQDLETRGKTKNKGGTPFVEEDQIRDLDINKSVGSGCSFPSQLLNNRSKTISRFMKDRKVIRSSQHGFSKGQSNLTNLIAFYEDDYVTKQTMGMVLGEGRAVDTVYLDLCKCTFKFEQQSPSLKMPLYSTNISMVAHCHVLLLVIH